MKKSMIFGLLIIIISISISEIHLFSADKFVQITKDGVNIRLEDNSSSTIIAKAKKGDVFELKSEKGQWYEINMFTGEYRYVHKSLATIVSYTPKLPAVSTAKLLWSESAKAEDKSIIEADKKYTPSKDLMKNIDYGRILEDRYKLKAFHKYNVPPADYQKILVEGAKKGWRD